MGSFERTVGLSNLNFLYGAALHDKRLCVPCELAGYVKITKHRIGILCRRFSVVAYGVFLSSGREMFYLRLVCRP